MEDVLKGLGLSERVPHELGSEITVMLRRLAHEIFQVRRHANEEPDKVVSIDFLGSENDWSSRIVARVVTATGERVIYKNKPCAIENWLSALLDQMDQRDFPVVCVPSGADRGGWSWFYEEVEHSSYKGAGIEVDPSVAACIARLRMTDLHVENVSISRNSISLLDCEMSFQPKLDSGHCDIPSACHFLASDWTLADLEASKWLTNSTVENLELGEIFFSSLDRLPDVRNRVVFLPTKLYAELISNVAKLLVTAQSRKAKDYLDDSFKSIQKFRKIPKEERIVAFEKNCLARLTVPRFYGSTRTRDLYLGRSGVLNDYFSHSGFEAVSAGTNSRIKGNSHRRLSHRQ